MNQKLNLYGEITVASAKNIEKLKSVKCYKKTFIFVKIYLSLNIKSSRIECQVQ